MTVLPLILRLYGLLASFWFWHAPFMPTVVLCRIPRMFLPHVTAGVAGVDAAGVSAAEVAVAVGSWGHAMS